MRRATATTAPSAAKIGDYLAQAFIGRVSAFYPFFPEGPLVRVHFIIGRSGGPTPEVPRATLEREIEAIVRTWTDGLVRSARTRAIRRKPRALVQALSRRLFRRLPRSLFAGGGRGRRRDHRGAVGRAPARRRFPSPPGRRPALRRPQGVEPGAADSAVGARAGAGEHGLPGRRRAHLPDRAARRRQRLAPRHAAGARRRRGHRPAGDARRRWKPPSSR